MGRFIVIIIVVTAVALAIYYAKAPQATPSGGGAANTSAKEPDYYLSGDVLFGKSSYASAIETYKKAFAQNPGSRKAPEAYYRIGKCYEELGQPEDALKAYEEFVARYPDDSHAALSKNRIEYLRGTGVK